MRRKSRKFFLVLVDRDTRIFNVVGPMVDDSEWNARIVQLQESDRDVTSFSSAIERSVEEAAAAYSRQTGYTYSTELISTLPPIENSAAAYLGPLPAYAHNANRARLVQLLCKSEHPHTAWGEMNADYPGEEALRSSQVGDFTATCLRCGHTTSDPYNWYRP